MTDIKDRLFSLHERIAGAAQAAQRDRAAITLVSVSKTQPREAVEAALQAGQRVFGENRVQEAAAKFGPLRALYPDLELHLIGPLQTNKVAQAVALFDVIETLDRPKLAEALSKEIKRQARTPRLYVEVNIGTEPQKSGLAPDALAGFLALCRDAFGLTIEGLMCIPPAGQDPAPDFARLKELADQHNLPHVSMGMSNDFEAAIAHGATHVRIGTALFGERVPQPTIKTPN